MKRLIDSYSMYNQVVFNHAKNPDPKCTVLLSALRCADTESNCLTGKLQMDDSYSPAFS